MWLFPVLSIWYDDSCSYHYPHSHCGFHSYSLYGSAILVHIAILIMMRNLGERAYNFAWVASRTPNVDDLCDGLEQVSAPEILDLRASNEVQNVV